MRPALAAALLVLMAAPTVAQAQNPASERMRAYDDLIRQQQVQQQINVIEQRQTTLELQRQSEQILRDMQAQSARAAPAPTAPPLSYTYSAPRQITEPDETAKAKAEKRRIDKAKAGGAP